MNLFRKCCAEFTGTFALVFAGCGALMVVERFPGAIAPFTIPIIFGLAIAIMIYAVGHISGAHFNPAVTWAFMIARHFPFKEVPAYWLAQCSGALGAITLLSLSLPAGTSFGATLPSVAILPAFIWEVVLSFFLMFVIIAVATDTRAVGMMAGAAIGATVCLDAFVGGPITGASMNPARSLAPALFATRPGPLWIYLTAPFLGTTIAALFYQWIRCEKEDAEPGAQGCC